MTTSKLVYCLIGSIVLTFGACQSPDSDVQNEEHQSDSLLMKRASITDSTLQALANESVIPGFAYSIVDSSGTLHHNEFGFKDLQNQIPMEHSTSHIIASVSKTFIGVAVMKLVDEGKLELDEEVNDILPFDVVNPHFPEIPITVNHLATHTCTLVDDFDPEEVGEADVYLLEELSYDSDSIQEYMDDDLSYYKLGKYLSLEENSKNYMNPEGRWYSASNYDSIPPGTQYSYSNLGAELAALIVEIRSGMPFAELTKREIFEPLGMKNTTWYYNELSDDQVSKLYLPDDWDDPKIAIEHPRYQYCGYPSGDLKSSMEDLSLYLQEMIKGYYGSGQLLSKSAYAQMFTPQLDESYFPEPRDTSAFNDGYNVGVFWAVSHTGYRCHNGGSMGVFSYIAFDPETGKGSVAFCNLPHADFGEIQRIVGEF